MPLVTSVAKYGTCGYSRGGRWLSMKGSRKIALTLSDQGEHLLIPPPVASLAGCEKAMPGIKVDGKVPWIPFGGRRPAVGGGRRTGDHGISGSRADRAMVGRPAAGPGAGQR